MERTQQYLVAALLVGVVLLAGIAFVQQPTPAEGGNATATDWQQVPLTDVRSGETFTIAELEPPVLVETFAVWCPTCLRQQKEVQKLHRQHPQVTSVSLDVDPNEDAAKVRAHLEEHGFDWRFAVAPTRLTQQLRAEFGNSVLVPTQAPMILVCADGVRQLPNGVKPAGTLWDHVQQGC